ncbi:MAG: tetratricopeptide repeat protein, partial [Candidatus Binataceae bacterium]
RHGDVRRFNLMVRFCPQCGVPVVAGARFCVECGESLATLDPSATQADLAEESSPDATIAAPVTPVAAPRRPRYTGAFAAVMAVILAIGLAVALIILRQLPARQNLLKSAPAPQPGTTSLQSGELPPGHPKIELPKEARDLITRIEQKARANPNDIAAWDRLGDVTERAGLFESSYYAKAREAYAHALKLNPDDLLALRGIGNIDFDDRKFDQAIAAYEHYLNKQPNDPDVRTDLATMYLSTGNADQAVVQYRKVLAKHPDFFQANFNLGVAYGEMNDLANARAAFAKALKLAPDQKARDRVNQMIAQVNSANAGEPAPGSAGLPAAQTAQSAASVPAANAPASSTFQAGLAAMLRSLPVAGPKVKTVQWPSEYKARVLMDNFPMDQMPPFAAAKFLGDLKAGITQVKQVHKVTSAVEVDICDAASGHVMQTITQ